MITNIRIKNFRSIIETSADLQPITVLVGANGTGKSNIVKCLQFLSSIPQRGLETSIISLGGLHSMYPKLLSNKEIKKAKIDLAYTVRIDEPENFPPDLGPIEVDHQLVLSSGKSNSIRLDREEIIFKKALALASSMRSSDEKVYGKTESSAILSDDTMIASTIKIIRQFGYNDKYELYPELSQENCELYVIWFGLNFIFKDTSKSPPTLQYVKRILDVFSKRRLKKERRSMSRVPEALIEIDKVNICHFSPESERFLELLARTKYYNLLQNELRNEQPISSLGTISFEGSNMPSALRHLKKKDEDAFNRILETLKEMNPFIDTADVNQLRISKEFIEFIEKSLKNKVESWETSDGTLRSLAILLALETHREYSTIIIEEPEQNLHPWAIRSLMNHIRQVTAEKNIQVVITTHSQQVLECVYPEEVLVVTRFANKGTKINTLKEIIPDHSIEMGEVGRLWVKGLLGGVPSYE
jgi:predicted ATPase